MTTATRKRNKRQTDNSNVAEVLDIQPTFEGEEFTPVSAPEDEDEDIEVQEPLEDEEIEEVTDPNEGGEVEMTAPGGGRNTKYEYPLVTLKDGSTREMTQKEKQGFRRQARAAARKGQTIDQALKNPRATGKTPQGRQILKQVLPNCERCGEPGDTAMAFVLPGDFLDHLNEKGQAHAFPVHSNSCMLATDIQII